MASHVPQTGGLDALKERISDLRLSSREAEILTYLASVADGHRTDEAAGLMADRLGGSREENYEAIVALQNKRLLAPSDGDTSKIAVDWDALGLPEEVRAEIQRRSPRFDVQGDPLSDRAREKLAELYRDRRPLYLALGVTPPERFRGLEERAERAARTVLLFPRKGDSGPLEHAKLYDETLKRWGEWLKQNNRREHIELRLTYRSYWYIRTSALSPTAVRFTVHHSSETANMGELIEAGNDTSLYKMVERFYRDALLLSIPWWSLYKRKFLTAVLIRLSPLLVIAAVIVVSVLVPTTFVIATGNAIIGLIGGGAARLWTVRPKLFDA